MPAGRGKGGRLLLKGKDKKLVAAGTRPIVSDGSAKGRLPPAKRGAWNPDNLYWAGKPAHTTEDASTNFKDVTSACATWPDSVNWNVTGIAQDWVAGAANRPSRPSPPAGPSPPRPSHRRRPWTAPR